VLQPLQEAGAAIKKLQDYESQAELASAVQATNAAVQKSLRYLLRADKSAPDDIRLAALSPNDLAPDRLIPALRQRNLISLDLAGQVHELDQAATRAQQGNVRAADGDLALRTVDHLRAEVGELGERPMREVAHAAVTEGPLDKPHAVRPSSRSPARIIAALVAVVVIALAAWLLLRKSPTEKGVAQFDKGDYSGAERTLSDVANENPGNATASYYLAILYRRSQRYDDAGRVVRRALDKTPNDKFLREELGNLFMLLNHPDLAAKQYRLAQQQDPKNARYWVKLVQALARPAIPKQTRCCSKHRRSARHVNHRQVANEPKRRCAAASRTG
jgi:tetratricopeptide (TPR) repeat protein